MQPLATPDDLAAYGFAVPEGFLAHMLLESVSAAVREAAGSPISVSTSTATLAGTREQFLPLPAGPVREVASVLLDGAEVMDYKIRDQRLWRPAGWGAQHVDVEVTWTHGLEPVPADVVQLVCMLVGAGLNQAAQGELGPDRRIAYESIDDYRIGFRQGDAEVVDPTEIPDRVKASLRARFGGQAVVTESY